MLIRGILLCICLTLTASLALAQPGRPATDTLTEIPRLKHPLFESNDSLDIIEAQGFDKLFDTGRYERTSTVTVNGEQDLPLARAIVTGDSLHDTLTVLIEDNRQDYRRQVRITITDRKFTAEYRFDYPMAQAPVIVHATDQVLLLNLTNFLPGREVHGILNFRGVAVEAGTSFADWNTQNSWVDSKFLIRGAFKARIERP